MVRVVDNGSSPEQRIDVDLVASFGPEFRLVELGDDAPPSPVTALNRGIAEARGDLIGVMIDGAHVLSPGVLSQALAAQRGYPPAVVAVQPFHLGPGQQGETMGTGYDQAMEDALVLAHYLRTTTLDVPDALADSLLEQTGNWSAEKPKTTTKKAQPGEED